MLPKLPIDLIIECSGIPEVAAKVALAALLSGKDVALMTVEADVTVGLLLSKIAAQTGAVYTVCRGDEPVECLKLVEYVQDIGLEVVCAGKGKNNPLDQGATPDALTEEAHSKGMNPRMLCSFVDGTKTMIEMAALANATGLPLSQRSMIGAPSTVPELHQTFRLAAEGGVLPKEGVIDYATGPVAPGVFVIAKSMNPVVRAELKYLKFGAGPYYSFYRPYHLASIEAVLSIGEVVLDRTPSLAPVCWQADVVATAKRDLKAGERIDGIGGFTVYGDAVAADIAADKGELPIGLAYGAVLRRDVAQGMALTYEDVALDERKTIVALRRLQDVLLAEGTLATRLLPAL
jgi:predicted homoserine dehydrogenase-like protein